MKIFAIVLFALSVALLVIGIHQVMLHGFSDSYWIFMFSTAAFFGYGYIKNYVLKQTDFLVNSKHASMPKATGTSKSKKKR